jgi:hypothetical protein
MCSLNYSEEIIQVFFIVQISDPYVDIGTAISFKNCICVSFLVLLFSVLRVVLHVLLSLFIFISTFPRTKSYAINIIIHDLNRSVTI